MRKIKTTKKVELRVLSFEELCKNKTIFPIIQRNISVKPDEMDWLIEEIFAELKDREDGCEESVIELSTFWLYEENDETFIFDGQQRSLYLACVLKAIGDIYPDAKIEIPNFQFEKITMEKAWNAFAKNGKVEKSGDEQVFYRAFNKLYKSFTEEFTREINRRKFSSEKKKIAFTEKFVNMVKTIIYECEITGLYAPTYEYAVQAFINTNSGNKPMAIDDFCRAYLLDTGDKMGIVFDTDLGVSLSSIVQTFYRFRIGQTKSEIKDEKSKGKKERIKTFTKINPLRNIIEDYISCSEKDFREFIKFARTLDKESTTKEYRFVDSVINRNDFTQIYQLAIANGRKINTEFTQEVLLKLACMSLAASLNQTRGSYFASLMEKMAKDINKGASSKAISSAIVTWLNTGTNKPATLSRDEFVEKLDGGSEKVKALALYILSMLDNKELSIDVDETDLEHLISKSNRQLSSKGIIIDKSYKDSLGNLYLIPKKHNRSTQDKIPKEKAEEYNLKIPASYKFETNKFSEDIVNANTKEELEKATSDRTERIVNKFINDSFFGSQYIR